MKTRTLSLITLLAVWTLVLAWCENAENTEIQNEEPLNEAAEFCINNGWTHEIVTTETAVYWECTLEDWTVCEEWDYLEWRCPIAYVKESLDLSELDKIIEDNFPSSYIYSTYSYSGNNIGDEYDHVYSTWEIGILTPEYSNIIDRELLNSGIEDWMIYTLVKATLDNWNEIQALYIVDPNTFDFVAASIEDGDLVSNYQFQY